MFRASCYTRLFSIAASALLLAGTSLQAQDLVLNGDFEDGPLPGCHWNLTNDQCTDMLNDITAFGTGNEIDVLTSPPGCIYGYGPQSGVHKIALAQVPDQADRDEIALGLAGNGVASGELYTLTLYVQGVAVFTGWGSVEVGLSTSPTEFGTPIGLIDGTPPGWLQSVLVFTAPINAAYLTLRAEANGPPGCWIHVDNVTLTPGLSNTFRRGDINGDLSFDISDAIATLTALFLTGSSSPPCLDAADANDDGVFDLSDAVYTLNALFLLGPPSTPAPGAITCGPDPTSDALDCAEACP